MWESKNHEKPKTKESKDEPIAEGDIVGNFVRRVDNDYNGVADKRLIGDDIADDDKDEEAAPVEPAGPAARK